MNEYDDAELRNDTNCLHFKIFKGTLSVILSDPPCKEMAMPDSEKYPWNLNLANHVQHFVVFMFLKLLIPNCFPAVEMRK